MCFSLYKLMVNFQPVRSCLFYCLIYFHKLHYGWQVTALSKLWPFELACFSFCCWTGCQGDFSSSLLSEQAGGTAGQQRQVCCTQLFVVAYYFFANTPSCYRHLASVIRQYLPCNCWCSGTTIAPETVTSPGPVGQVKSSWDESLYDNNCAKRC